MDDHQKPTTDKTPNPNGDAAAHAHPAADRKEGKAHQPPAPAQKDVAHAKRRAGELLDQATTVAGEAFSTAENLGEQAQDVARRIGDQTAAGMKAAGKSLSRSTGANPLTALLVAGAIGYALSYLVHRH